MTKLIHCHCHFKYIFQIHIKILSRVHYNGCLQMIGEIISKMKGKMMFHFIDE